MKGKQRESNSSQNEQSETTEITKVIRTQQTFNNHHYGTTEASRSKKDS
jgi:hypothetical protein